MTAPISTHPQILPHHSVHIAMHVNGQLVARPLPARTLLSDFLRDGLGLIALHVGCGEGACGACTVLVDGEPSRACTLLAAQVGGSEVVTVEGLNLPHGLNPLQAAFQKSHGLQCGYCTPGILVSLTELFARDPFCDEAAVRTCLTGHLCRCTGYAAILTAALAYQRDLQAGSAA
jgi:aerobic-type carbon monoxide dehydrogenase small subunit (CoxS/CutS family)